MLNLVELVACGEMPRQGPNPNSEPGRELALNAEGSVCLVAFAKLPMVLLLVLFFR